MNFIIRFKNLFRNNHKPGYGALDIFKYIGPGLLVTVGFIDPGNWASNLAAGSGFGYELLWMVTLSTIMLIVLQHNVAHLGIATGLCLSEAATIHLKKWISRSGLFTAIIASVSTTLAELLGAAIALKMLFNIPINAGCLMTAVFILAMLFTNSYQKIEKWIIGFVSLIGISFIYELNLVDIDWNHAMVSWMKPALPAGSILIVMSVLGAVVMPHNLFLHSEIIQSRQWNCENESVIKRQLKYEFFDTLFSMIVGWGINSAMILLAASAFFNNNLIANELQQAERMLRPLLGGNAAIVFAFALLLSGISSCLTSCMAGGSIFAGLFGEPYDLKDNHTRTGVFISLIFAILIILVIRDAFKGLIISQVILSIQLPITIFMQVKLTSSGKVMGKFVNKKRTTVILIITGLIITYLNVRLLLSLI